MTCDLVSGSSVLLLSPKLTLAVYRSGHARDVSNETSGIYVMTSPVKVSRNPNQNLRMAALKLRLLKAEALPPMPPLVACPSKSALQKQG